MVAPRYRQETVEQQTVDQETASIEAIEALPQPSVDEHISILRQVFTDFSRELGDDAHAASNATRGVNLWRRSGLSRYEFVRLAYEARKRTRLYQGKQPPGTRIEAKGAYFFAVLEDLVARRGAPSAGRDPPVPPPVAAPHRTPQPPAGVREEAGR